MRKNDLGLREGADLDCYRRRSSYISSNRNMLHTIDTVHDGNGLRINRYSDDKWAATFAQMGVYDVSSISAASSTTRSGRPCVQ